MFWAKFGCNVPVARSSYNASHSAGCGNRKIHRRSEDMLFPRVKAKTPTYIPVAAQRTPIRLLCVLRTTSLQITKSDHLSHHNSFGLPLALVASAQVFPKVAIRCNFFAEPRCLLETPRFFLQGHTFFREKTLPRRLSTTCVAWASVIHKSRRASKTTCPRDGRDSCGLVCSRPHLFGCLLQRRHNRKRPSRAARLPRGSL